MAALCAFRFVAQIQALVCVSRKSLPYFADAKLIPLACESLPQALHAKSGMLSLSSFAAPHGFQFGFEARTRADAQIGGDERVGDAFPAMVGLQLVAIREW